MKAFFLALGFFALTVTGCHLGVNAYLDSGCETVGTWTDEAKSKNRAGITKNLTENSIVVFGSSEFQHGIDTIYHPSQVFAGTDCDPMLIGAGYYQSLSHAITLAAIEPYLQNRKAVLILSPQWFRKTGVVDQAYASRFSETLYLGMLENETLSEETREYLQQRTETLLQADPKMQERIEAYDRQEGTETFREQLMRRLRESFLKEKDDFMMAAGLALRGEKTGNSQEQSGTIDWEGLMQQAQQEGEAQQANPFYMDPKSYAKLEPHLPEKKDISKDAVNGYQNSPEYDDLRCFLSVCRELSVEPMLIVLPVNGYYYDYTGFPKEAREGYYRKVCRLAEEFGVRVADFSGQEYTRYFFEDRVHLGKKGWVMINESIYRFYEEA